MIAIRRLAESGQAAWVESQRGFPSDPDAPQLPAEPDPFAMIRSQLDLTTVIVVGDMAMDDLAYCELVRRGRLPNWPVGGYVPPWWRAFMELLDAATQDRMRTPARYLDITLAAARDQLIVHRDPAGWEFPSWSSWGAVGRDYWHVDAERRTLAMAELRAVNASLPARHYQEDDEQLLDILIAVSGRLGLEQRRGILRAYSYAEVAAPPVVDITNRALQLLRWHAEELDRQSDTGQP